MACLRFCHIHLLWTDEDYHLAAAIDILHGKIPYRDFWYDKPPLNAIYYLLIAGYAGWPLRILDAAYILLACYLAYRLARTWWSEAEGSAAALLLAFFTTFYLPSAVIPYAADALMIAPHIAAIYCASRKLAVWAGVYAGIAFWVNPKAVFVLAVCAFWMPTKLSRLLLGFTALVAAGVISLLALGAWPHYFEQVWRWGWLYASGSYITNPFRTGALEIAHWFGFEAVLVLGTAFAFAQMARNERWGPAVWIALSFVAVCLGARFLPRYFWQLLPPLVIMASRGVVLAFREHRTLAAVVLAIGLGVPLVRFGPRYVVLADDDITHRQPHWSDVAMDLDGRQAAALVCSSAKRGDTLFVWGYRPDLYVYTRMTSDSIFWDSQPLTGVPADRHLTATSAIYNQPAAAANRRELASSHPTFLVDGLSLLNPRLAPDVYPELQHWLTGYVLIGRTRMSLIYRRSGGY